MDSPMGKFVIFLAEQNHWLNVCIYSRDELNHLDQILKGLEEGIEERNFTLKELVEFDDTADITGRFDALRTMKDKCRGKLLPLFGNWIKYVQKNLVKKWKFSLFRRWHANQF